jgi:hypothetical protein
MSGKHGQASRDTEVPRRTLVDALKNETDLTNTQELGAAQSSPLCELVTVAVAKAAPTTRKARAQRARPR